MAKESEYLILFADLIGNTEVAAEVSTHFYAKTYISSLHWAATRALRFIKVKAFGDIPFTDTIDEFRVGGDELFVLKRLPEKSKVQERQDIVASAVAFAYVLKLLWLASPYSLSRIKENAFLRELAIGLHIGPGVPVHIDPIRENGKTIVKGVQDVAGVHLNVAKRLETAAREGNQSRIFASPDISSLFHPWCRRYKGRLPPQKSAPLLYSHFRQREERVQAKGIPRQLQVEELVWDYTNAELLDLLNELTSLDKAAAVDNAAYTLGGFFLEETTHPFWNPISRDAAVELPNSLQHVKSAAEYIQAWFTALNGYTSIFKDEPWLNMNCFLASWTLIRHPCAQRQGSRHFEAWRRIGLNLLANYMKAASRPPETYPSIA